MIITEQTGKYPKLAMTAKSLKFIHEGKKVCTTRRYKLKHTIYELPDGTLIKIIAILVCQNFSKLDGEKWAIFEGYDSLKDIRVNCQFQHIKDFINGRYDGIMYIHRFKLVKESLNF